MPKDLRRTGVLNLSIAIAMVLGVAGVSFANWRQYEAEATQGRKTRELLASLDGALRAVLQAESAQRGYLLTGQSSYLEPYGRAIQDLSAKLEALTPLEDGFGRMRRFDRDIADKLAELRLTVDLRSNKSASEALAMVLSGRGKTDMDEITRIGEQMESELRNRLNLYARRARGHAATAALVSTGGSLVLAVFLIFASFTIRNAAVRRETLLREIKASRDLLETTVASVGDAFVATDTDGRVLIANATAEILLGVLPGKLVGHRLEDILVLQDEETGERISSPLDEVLGSGQAVRLRNDEMLAVPDGRLIPVANSCAPIRDGEGKTIGAVVILRDVSEQRNAARQLQLTNARLTAANEDLRQFAFAASHDLQEPLRMVTSYVQFLVRRYKGKVLDDSSEEFLRYIVDGTTRMRALVNALLEYASAGEIGEPDAFQSCHLEAVLSDTLANLHASIEESGAQISNDHLPEIGMDAVHAGQILQNLISNAIKYRGSEPPRIHIKAARDAGMWQIAIADNGVGIEPEYFNQVFVLFKRLHGSERPGSGIGLPICKKIVESYGGRIWVESQPGKGSTFFFTAPESGSKGAATIAQAEPVP